MTKLNKKTRFNSLHPLSFTGIVRPEVSKSRGPPSYPQFELCNILLPGTKCPGKTTRETSIDQIESKLCSTSSDISNSTAALML